MAGWYQTPASMKRTTAKDGMAVARKVSGRRQRSRGAALANEKLAGKRHGGASINMRVISGQNIA